MFYQLLYIHLYRPFLKYTKSTSPLPPHVSPRKLCTQGASAISKLLRIYKRTYGLHQICNISVYMAHSACTIHLLNLPDKNAQRDIIHGCKHLEEISESWLCARRTLRILDLSAANWNIALPNQASAVLDRTRAKYGSWGSWNQVQSPTSSDEYSILAVRPASREPPISIPTPGQIRMSTCCADPHPTTNLVEAPNSGEPPQSVSYCNTYPTRYSSPPACICDSNAQPLDGDAPRPRVPCILYTQRDQPQQVIDVEDLPQQHIPRTQPNISAPNMGQPIPMPSSYDDGGSLVRESQDWWLKDQSALALGLNNWVDDWSGNTEMDLESNPSITAMDGGILTNPSTNNTNSNSVTGPGTPVVQLKMEDGTTAPIRTPMGNIDSSLNQYISFSDQPRPPL